MSMMDRNAPPGLLATADTAIADSRDLIGRWHGKGRQRYAVTPRFAITSTEEQLAAAGALLAEFPTVLMQTHLAENLRRDRRRSSSCFRAMRATRPSMTASACSARARCSAIASISTMTRSALLRDSRSVAVFCPTSNLFIGSGLFDYEAARGSGRAHRARDRRRRRHVLFDAAHRRRSLQGDAAAGARTCRRSQPST